MTPTLPHIDPATLTHAQLVAVVRELLAFIGHRSASDVSMLESVDATMNLEPGSDPEAVARAVALALGAALVTWSETVEASRQVAFDRIAVALGGASAVQ